MLVKYVRNERGDLIGAVVSTERYAVGWSCVNRKMGDVFNKDMARLIASGRAKYNVLYDENQEILPATTNLDIFGNRREPAHCPPQKYRQLFIEEIEDMYWRSKSYFQPNYVKSSGLSSQNLR